MMRRRDCLKTLAIIAIGSGIVPEAIARNAGDLIASSQYKLDDHIRDYLHKMKHFDKPHKDDLWVHQSDYRTFKSVVMRLRRLEKIAGHGNFQVLSFDDGLAIARKYPEVGEFTRAEIGFIEMIFYSDASRYGFFGHKPLDNLTDRIRIKSVRKVPYTGNYLFNAMALEAYEKIKKEIGEDVTLTSGVRGVMKQFLLFLNKVYKSKGNLSLASRSLAPPGYSFHGKGDFDVGQTGFGIANFTERFTTTRVFKILSDLGYINLRYPQNNFMGVRFEPWHIKLSKKV
jgi:hypothetical protein